MAPQGVIPVRTLPPPGPHTPLRQVTPGAQALPQAPQLSSSSPSATQLDAHGVGISDSQVQTPLRGNAPAMHRPSGDVAVNETSPVIAESAASPALASEASCPGALPPHAAR